MKYFLGERQFLVFPHCAYIFYSHDYLLRKQKVREINSKVTYFMKHYLSTVTKILKFPHCDKLPTFSDFLASFNFISMIFFSNVL